MKPRTETTKRRSWCTSGGSIKRSIDSYMMKSEMKSRKSPLTKPVCDSLHFLVSVVGIFGDFWGCAYLPAPQHAHSHKRMIGSPSIL